MTLNYSNSVESGPPKVIMWFKLYTGFLCMLYLLVMLMSILFFNGTMLEPGDPPAVAWIMGTVMLGVGLIFFTACLLPLVLKPRPWVWIYDLVIICVGMTSACTLPASIPLLIFWMKPEVKRYFGRT